MGERFPDLDFSRVPSSGGFQKSSANTLLRGDLVNLNEDYDFKLHLELKIKIDGKLIHGLSKLKVIVLKVNYL